jgi:5'-3' exonuclease
MLARVAGGARPERLMLLDTASLYFRAYYAIPDSVTAPDGTPVNAVRGLLDMTARLVRERQPTQLVACIDADWRPQWRVDAVPAYKAHRVAEEVPAGAGLHDGEVVPDTLAPQVPVIFEVLDAFGIAAVGVDGYEADDVIGTIATRAACPVDVVTGDRDLFQLVRDDVPVRVIYTVKGLGELADVDEAEITKRYGIPGRAYADFALLRGDPSDGLPGVPGIGEKTAASIVKAFGSVEAAYDAVDAGGLDPKLPKGAAAKLAKGRDYVDVARAVVCVATDLKVPKHDPALPPAPKHPKKVAALAERWGIESPVERLTAALETAATAR